VRRNVASKCAHSCEGCEESTVNEMLLFNSLELLWQVEGNREPRNLSSNSSFIESEAMIPFVVGEVPLEAYCSIVCGQNKVLSERIG